jgi:hypothetical protein
MTSDGRPLPHLLSISSFIKNPEEFSSYFYILDLFEGPEYHLSTLGGSMFFSLIYFFAFQSRAQSLTFNLFKSLTFNPWANKPVVGQFHSMSKAKIMCHFVLTPLLYYL